MSYDSTVLALSPVSFWPLASNANDSADGNNGTANGSPTFGGAGFCNLDGSVALNGSTQYISVADAVNLRLSAPLSLEAWFKTSSTGSFQVICAKYAPSTFVGYGLSVTNTNQLGMLVGDGWHSLGPTVTDGAWHHGVATLSGSTITIYLDGVPVGTATATVSLSNTNGLKIGTDPTSAGSSSFNGSLSSVAAYGFALSSAQVRSNYVAGGGPNYAYLSGRPKPQRPVIRPQSTRGLLACLPLHDVGGTSGFASKTYDPNVRSYWLASGGSGIARSLGPFGPCMGVPVNDCVNFGTPLNGSSEFTLLALTTLTATPSTSTPQQLWGQEQTGTGSLRVSLFNSPFDVYFQVGNDGSFANLSAPLPPLNVPVLITARLTPAGVRSIWYGPYKVAERTDAGISVPSTGDSLGLGASQRNANRSWPGAIHGAEIYTRALLDPEIMAKANDLWADVRPPRMSPAILAAATAPTYAYPPVDRSGVINSPRIFRIGA